MMNEKAGETCLICVDAGTTNTRVWLTAGDRVIARARAGVGVRDTARDGSSERLRDALRELIDQVRGDARDQGLGQSPGMCHRSRDDHFAARPGRSPARSDPRRIERIGRLDATIQFSRNHRSAHPAHSWSSFRPATMRPGDCRNHGRDAREETLLVGLHALGLIEPQSTLLNLGSHWKVIEFDARARIASSVTSMTGELIHTAQTQTILAGSVPQTRQDVRDQTWLEAGMREQRRSGLARALFCVRLLEQGSDGSAEQRLSFLIGVFWPRM